MHLMVFATLVATMIVCPYVCDGRDLLPLPTKTDYKASSVKYDSGGMGPMFDFARSFINTALPGGFPKQLVNETMSAFTGQSSSSFNIMDTGMQLLHMYMGWLIALGIGILFFVIFPIVGLCFCCCRCCGNCGGKMQQESDPSMHCKRRIFACIMLVIVAFTLTGNICTYVANDRMSVALDKLGGSVSDNLDDIDSFLDLVVQQVETLGVTNLKTTKATVLSVFNGTHLQEQFTDFVLDSVAKDVLENLENDIAEAKISFEDLHTSTDKLHDAFVAACNGFASCISSDPTILSPMNIIQTQYTTFQGFTASDTVSEIKGNLTAEVQSNLPDLTQLRLTVTNAFTRIESQVNMVVTEVKNFRSSAKDGIDIDEYKNIVRNYASSIKDFDNYRHIAGAILAALTTLIVALQLFGLTMGAVGQGRSTQPEERGCVSTAGGNMLMASVGVIFIFGAFLMLLTTLSFAVGSILERFVCQPLSDPNLEMLQIADSFVPTKTSLGVGLVDVMKSCRADQSAYIAFNLKSRFDFAAIEQELQDQKVDMKRQVQLKMARLKTTTFDIGAAAGPSLTTFQNSIAGINIQNIINKIDGIGTSTALPFTSVSKEMNDLKQKLHDFKNLQTKVAGWIPDLQRQLTRATHALPSQLTPTFDRFTDKVLEIVEKFVNMTKKAVNEDLGRCSPIWNLYESILVVSVCQYTVDSFNGFWFSIGWCIFFFIPGIIFAVKLAKHYRRMESVSSKMARNKVSHSDVETGSENKSPVDDKPNAEAE